MFQGTSYCCTCKNRQSFFGEKVSSHTRPTRRLLLASFGVGVPKKCPIRPALISIISQKFALYAVVRCRNPKRALTQAPHLKDFFRGLVFATLSQAKGLAPRLQTSAENPRLQRCECRSLVAMGWGWRAGRSGGWDFGPLCTPAQRLVVRRGATVFQSKTQWWDDTSQHARVPYQKPVIPANGKMHDLHFSTLAFVLYKSFEKCPISTHINHTTKVCSLCGCQMSQPKTCLDSGATFEGVLSWLCVFRRERAPFADKCWEPPFAAMWMTKFGGHDTGKKLFHWKKDSLTGKTIISFSRPVLRFLSSQVIRSSGSSGVLQASGPQVIRPSGSQVFKLSGPQVLGLSGHQVFTG